MIANKCAAKKFIRRWDDVADFNSITRPRLLIEFDVLLRGVHV